MERPLIFRNIFPSNVVAFVSDRTVDFARKDDTLHLTQKQKIFLSRHSGVKISQLPNIKQVHGKRIIVIKKPSCVFTRSPLKADGLMTQKTAIPLTVRTADCLSIFIYDPKHKAIALVHAGWRGTKKNIASSVVRVMIKKWKANPKDLKVVWGPSIRACCYKVGKEFKKFFPEEIRVKEKRLYLDLPLANKRQLVSSGVNPKNIYDCKICTHCNRRFFSYRREGEKAGRMISFMMLKSLK